MMKLHISTPHGKWLPALKRIIIQAEKMNLPPAKNDESKVEETESRDKAKVPSELPAETDL